MKANNLNTGRIFINSYTDKRLKENNNTIDEENTEKREHKMT
jgi:hypothetical protein